MRTSSTRLQAMKATMTALAAPALVAGVTLGTLNPVSGAANANEAACLPEGTTVAFDEAADSSDPVERAAAARAVRDTSLTVADTVDGSVGITGCGIVFYADQPITRDDIERIEGSKAARAGKSARFTAAPAPLSQTFDLASRPGADVTIYLDFDGHSVRDTQWNAMYDIPGFEAAPYNFEGSPSTFTDTELMAVQLIWAGVAEDYAPFNINVTTSDPGAAAILRSSEGDTKYGTRAVFTGDNPISNSCGCQGIAFLDIWSFSGADSPLTQPAFVFTTGGAGEFVKVMADTATHEIGHNIGLVHDGLGNREYHDGSEPWAPIMGSSYYQPVAQWSRGDYRGATSDQDDLAVIARRTGRVTDDAGNTSSDATTLLASGATSAARNGIIGAAAGGDRDVYSLTLPAGASVSAQVTPTGVLTNLDTSLTLLDSDGRTVLAKDAPFTTWWDFEVARGMDAALTDVTVPAAGRYFLLVAGAGQGGSLDGYDEYGSIGSYRLSVSTTGGSTVPEEPTDPEEPEEPVDPTDPEEPEEPTGPGPDYRNPSVIGDFTIGYVGRKYRSQISALNGEPTFSWARTGKLPTGLSATFTGTGNRDVVLTGKPRKAGKFKVTFVATDTFGRTAKHTEVIYIFKR